MDKQEVRERAYKILYLRYRKIHEEIVNSAIAAIESGDPEARINLVSDMVDLKKYVPQGILNESDLAVIESLENCLGEKSLISKFMAEKN